MAHLNRCLVFVILSATAALGQTKDVEPGTVSALNRMSAYMQTLTAFQIHSVTTTDEVVTDGQKIQYRADVDILIRRPDRLRAEVTGDRQHRLLFYDGKSFTLWAQRLDLYASAPAPPTIGEWIKLLGDRYDIELPLTDLYYWGTKAANTEALTSAFDVGPSQVGGTTCEHFALRQSGVDWQVWIQQGDFPLPRRLIITTTDDDARPEYTSEMTWNLAPSFNDAAFTFTPDASAKKIVFASK